MNDFSIFQNEVRDVLAQFDYSVEDINYINLSDKYSVSARVFFEFQGDPPGLETEFRSIAWANTWMVPKGFRIIMNDGGIFMYVMIHDEYYSSWLYTARPKPSPVEIYLDNENVSYVNRA
jgi:hypothetical protein